MTTALSNITALTLLDVTQRRRPTNNKVLLPSPSDKLTRPVPTHSPLHRLLPLSPVTNTPSLWPALSRGGGGQHNGYTTSLLLVIAESLQITRCDEVHRRWGRGIIKVTELEPRDLCIYSWWRKLCLKRSGNLTGHWPNPHGERVRGWRGQERRDKCYTAGHEPTHSKLTCEEKKKKKENASVVRVCDDFCLHAGCG